jgi:hypothetical protein
MTKFDLDTKIELNKERLNRDLQDIRNVQNSYPLFFAYLAFMSLYLTDFFKYIKNFNTDKNSDLLILILTVITSILLIWSIVKFIQLIYPQKIFYDKLPKEVYNDYMSEIIDYSKENDLDIEEETKKGYLEYLEEAVFKNFNIYVRKRQLFYHVVLISIVSIIPYSILLIIKFIYYG